VLKIEHVKERWWKVEDVEGYFTLSEKIESVVEDLRGNSQKHASRKRAKTQPPNVFGFLS